MLDTGSASSGAQSLEQWNNLLAAMGTNAKQALTDTTDVFGTIGSMAEQQIGHRQ